MELGQSYADDEVRQQYHQAVFKVNFSVHRDGKTGKHVKHIGVRDGTVADDPNRNGKESSRLSGRGVV